MWIFVRKMVCNNSVTTPRGKFTLYTEEVTRCEAKRKCKQRGKILAPITTQHDFDKIRALQENNEVSYECAYGFGHFYEYHIGLDVKNVGGKLIKEFEDGTKWDDCEMNGLYKQHGTPKCPIARYITLRNYPLSINSELMGGGCGEVLHRYICLKPAKKIIRVVKAKSKKVSQPLLQESHGGFALLPAIGAVMVLMCVFAVAGWKKVKRCEEEVKEMKKIVASQKK